MIYGSLLFTQMMFPNKLEILVLSLAVPMMRIPDLIVGCCQTWTPVAQEPTWLSRPDRWKFRESIDYGDVAAAAAIDWLAAAAAVVGSDNLGVAEREVGGSVS